MFTGLVEAVGRVTGTVDLEGGRQLSIEAPEITADLAVGDSVALDGACLTVTDQEGETFGVEAIGTTLARTVAGRYGPGSRVNLERALRVGDRIGGHFVQGHVDGLAELLRVQSAGEYRLMDFRVPAEVDEVTVLHGSITLNGVSLTVNALPAPGRCQVAIIPLTWERTNLALLQPGDLVNVEGDLIGKYVGRVLATRGLKVGEPRPPSQNYRE